MANIQLFTNKTTSIQNSFIEKRIGTEAFKLKKSLTPEGVRLLRSNKGLFSSI